MSPPRSLVALAVAAVFAPPVSAQPPAGDAALVKTAQGMFKGLKTETLPNGLRVYLLPVPGSPVVTTMVAYRVGSGDEEKDQTGLSHYLEHLLFKGTEKLMPGDIDRATQRSGGHNNAYTSEDMTVYHFDFAADRWTTALDIEADRMRNVRIDEKHEFQQEKGAVIAELARNEDGPWDLEYKAILPMLFPKESPYSHPVIGERAHVRGATAEIIKRHYDKWYHPNNAAIVVVGGFDPAEAMARIRKQFGSIPAADLPPRKKPTTFPDRAGPVRKEIPSKFDVPRLMVGFNTIAVGDPDDPVLDVLQQVLAEGKTSRLYRRLVEDDRLASSVSAGNNSGRYPGWFSVQVEMLKGKDRAKAEAIVFEELAKLANEPVSDAELARARRKMLAGFVFSRESTHDLANTIARVSTYPGGEDVSKYMTDYLDRVLRVSKEDIQRAAKKYFAKSNAVLVWSVPKGDAEEQAGRAGGVSPLMRDNDAMRRANRGLTPPPRQDKGTATFSLKNAKRVVLPNGMVVILLEDHRLPVVVAAADVADVRLREPAEKAGIAAMVGGLLEEGTDKHTGKEISALIEDTGGSLSLGSSGGSLKVLTPDTDLGLGLLFECLMRPTFPADALERQRDQQLSAIDENESQPRTRARMLFNATVYGDHPFGRPSLGKKEVVAKLTADDLKAFHKAAFAPNLTTVAVVGDFNADEMAKKIEALTKDWPKAEAAKPTPPAPPKPDGQQVKIVPDPTAAQVHVYIGQLGIKRTDPDYYKLLVMDNVLGTGPGFTDRLSSTIRDRKGLAYTVNANITGSAGTQPGTFTGYIGTFPDKFLDVRTAFFNEVERLRAEPPTAQEVEDAKKYLLGSLPFRFTTAEAVAGELLAAERYGLGFDFLEKYRAEVGAVTPADVRAMAKKHIDPKTLAVIAVGPIDKDGKPLPEMPEKKN
jgi:zinc protease